MNYSNTRLRIVLFALLSVLFSCKVIAQKDATPPLLTGADRLSLYLPLLENKRVGLLINQTSVIGNTLLVDTLKSLGVNLKTIFVPEHGFRGTADAGAHVSNSLDKATGLPVISLYGNNKKPTAEQLKDIDILIYDLQDVGTRFYTYISTLEYAMEACAEQQKTILILDRPNPNDFVDGPVLDKQYKSFVGMQEIPVVYGMTVAEYALMLVGEKLVKGASSLHFKYIPCMGWERNEQYQLPVAPSPNLKSFEAVSLYPSLCFFEGTMVSVGRGTAYPFTVWGHPQFKDKTNFSFVPKSVIGATNPIFSGQECYGQDLSKTVSLLSANKGEKVLLKNRKIDLQPLLTAYSWAPDKTKFFNNFFKKLSGTEKLELQIAAGMEEEKIRKSWQPALAKFQLIRKKYLLYTEQDAKGKNR